MDYSYLLEIAEMNKKKAIEEPVNLLKSTLPKPKKVARPTPKGEAIKAFLDKKESEKKKADEEFKKQRDELLYKRSLDKHSSKRMNTMIKRTKGASKAVLEDAKDLITVNGEEEQYGKDDYGYESTHSQNIFNKLVNQYKDGPKDDRLNVKKTAKRDLKNIKDRVKDSLRQEQDESLGIRKRHRKRQRRNSDDFINDGDSYKKFPSSEKAKLPEPPKPPREETPKKKKRVNKGPPPMSFEDLMKAAQKKAADPVPDIIVKDILEPTKPTDTVQRPMTAREKKEAEEERLRKLRRAGKLPKEEPKPAAVPTLTKVEDKPQKSETKTSKKPPPPQPKVIDRSKYFAVPSSSKNKQTPPTTSSKPKIPSVSRSHPAEKSASSYKPKSNPPMKRHQVIDDDDDSEYDSEMDDFIDDGDQELDYSSEIGKIFGYNKAKYRGIDEEDDASMVASFGDVEREEKFSSKVGMMEDLEDIRREEMEKKAKLKRKKMMMKNR